MTPQNFNKLLDLGKLSTERKIEVVHFLVNSQKGNANSVDFKI